MRNDTAVWRRCRRKLASILLAEAERSEAEPVRTASFDGYTAQEIEVASHIFRRYLTKETADFFRWQLRELKRRGGSVPSLNTRLGFFKHSLISHKELWIDYRDDAACNTVTAIIAPLLTAAEGGVR